ncbi:Dienelactone hydrolase [Crenothrix polyspora]|jgi:dienelactone hydrolase|uniref:Dienelactone hydrolase n=1 Tax=Crenothrix polyspora TaxID=360316 RepID=A0A1R4H257_9GAMM|nr:dienelactone hydrolase family protein [Crenothrix polyspora]SJM90327.1 Dienelactone hydrolase [Crenothrix polyspora]
MAIITNTTNYRDGETLLEAFVAFDDAISGYRPAVLIHHTWCGRDAFVAEKARQIAELGYVGIAVDLYGKGVLGTNPEENAVLMQPFMADRLLLRQRLMAAYRNAKLMPWVDSHTMAAIGFCFGGLCTLDLARSGVDIKGVVSFHGMLHAPDDIKTHSIKAKVLALHGNNDPLAPIEDVLAFEQEMSAAEADWQLHTYGNTGHAFTNPAMNDRASGFYFQADANRRAWLAMQNFLAEVFA